MNAYPERFILPDILYYNDAVTVVFHETTNPRHNFITTEGARRSRAIIRPSEGLPQPTTAWKG